MRLRSSTTAAVLATTAVALLAGCSGDSSPSAVSAAGSNSGASSVDRLAQTLARPSSTGGTGIAPKFLGELNIGIPSATEFLPISSPYKELAVSDFGTKAVAILGPAFHSKSVISNGLSSADGNWIDASKNLYVADHDGMRVQEYASGSSTPTFTYDGLFDPINVTTDAKGNVYVANSETIIEFPQGVDRFAASCTVDGQIEGVALDASGNAFASFNNGSTGYGNIIEFPGGLGGCQGTILPPTLGFAGGLQIANDGTIVVADQYLGVDLIPMPYTSIASTITGAKDPFRISLTKFNKLLFIADPANADVLVVHYPSGSPYLTLGAANGLTDPDGVAAYEVGEQ